MLNFLWTSLRILLFCLVHRGKKALIYSHPLNCDGGTTALLQLCRALRGQGLSVVSLVRFHGNNEAAFKKLGIPVFCIEDYSALYRVFRYLGGFFDLTVCNAVRQYQFIELLEKLNRKYVWWIHESVLLDEWMTPDMLKAVQTSRHIYCVSPAAQRYMNKYNPQSKILSLAIDDLYDQYKSQFQHNDKTVFIDVAMVKRLKGADVLVDAFAALSPEERQQCEVWFVGKIEPDSEPIVTAGNAIEQIRFFDTLPHDQTMTMMAKTDVLILPSRGDSFGLTVPEALSMNKTVVVSQQSGVSEMLENGKDAYIFDVNNPSELTDILRRLIGVQNRPGQMNNRQTYERLFSIQTFNENVARILEEEGI